MKQFYSLFFSLMLTTLVFGQEALITGYVDSPCPGQLGRTLEIYVDGTVDFTNYTLERQANGGGFTSSIDLASLGTITDDFAYITNDATTLQTEFGITTNVFESSFITDNGNDGFQIVDGAMNIIDRFGEENVDGDGTAWFHLDSYYKRVDGTPANGGSFSATQFIFGAVNELDGEGLCNSASSLGSIVPFGTYSTVASTEPTINVSGDITGLDYFEGNGPSAEQSISISGINLTDDITVTAPTNFEISLTADGTYGTNVMIPQTSGTASAPVYVRLVAGLGQGSYSASVTATSTGADTKNVSVSGTVSPADPEITIFGGVNPLNYLESDGGPSDSDSFGVSGQFLNEGITIAASTNFEVSLMADSGFASTVIIPDAGGTVSTTDVFVRLVSGLSEGAYAGTITANSDSATEQVLAVEGNVFGPPTNSLVITGVFDGPRTGGTPKGVELYALNDIPDLSLYGIGSANNGDGSDGQEFTFPSDMVSAGDYIYVATESVEFQNFFGFPPTYDAGFAIAINGDDAVELFENGVVIDTFGDINVDGTGQPWEYTDGWAYRKDDTGPDGTTFVLDNWNFSGLDELEGDGTNSGASTSFPLGTYMNTLSLGDLEIGSFKIYPNPVSNGYVNIARNNSEEIAISVFDILGKMVISKTLGNERLDVSNLNAGVYIVKLTQDKATVSKKLVIR